jgi:hypothetical protein
MPPHQIYGTYGTTWSARELELVYHCAQMFLISNVLWFGHLGGGPLYEATRITIFVNCRSHS